MRPSWRALLPCILLSALAGSLGSAAPAWSPDHPLIGTLQSDPGRVAATNGAGAWGVVVGVSWDRAEPEEGKFDGRYLQELQDRIAAFRQAGKQVVLDPGVQYPPRWLFAYP